MCAVKSFTLAPETYLIMTSFPFFNTLFSWNLSSTEKKRNFAIPKNCDCEEKMLRYRAYYKDFKLTEKAEEKKSYLCNGIEHIEVRVKVGEHVS